MLITLTASLDHWEVSDILSSSSNQGGLVRALVLPAALTCSLRDHLRGDKRSWFQKPLDTCNVHDIAMCGSFRRRMPVLWLDRATACLALTLLHLRPPRKAHVPTIRLARHTFKRLPSRGIIAHVNILMKVELKVGRIALVRACLTAMGNGERASQLLP